MSEDEVSMDDMCDDPLVAIDYATDRAEDAVLFLNFWKHGCYDDDFQKYAKQRFEEAEEEDDGEPLWLGGTISFEEENK